MSYTKTFKEINKADVAIAGGKGASLGEMTQAGISVPPGFVVLASAFDEFLKITDLNVELDAILDQVHHEVMHEVDDASEKIKALILGKAMPQETAAEITAAFKKLDAKFVAVRSSATSEDSAAAAWAGQLDTYLNTTQENLLANVKKCWASLFTPRAIFYRFEKGYHNPPSKGGEGGFHGGGSNSPPYEGGGRGGISVAVVIQKMIQSEVSGIAFSVHPVTQDYDQLIIEAGFGLGEAIVSGSITPDSYVIEKSTNTILDKNITTQEKGLFRRSYPLDKGGEGSFGKDCPPDKGELEGVNQWRDLSESQGAKPTLTDHQILDLSQLVQKIEKHYDFPVDVEWAREKGKFYIVQSRPITTLPTSATTPKEKYDFSWGERHSVISTEAWLRGYVSLREIIGNDNKNVFMYVKGGQVHTYNTAKDLQPAIESGQAVLDHSFLEKHLQQSANVREEFRALYEQMKQTDLVDVPSDQLRELFEYYQNLFDKTWAYFKVSQPEYLELAKERLEQLIKEKSRGKNVEQTFITLTTPTELDLIKEEEIAALGSSASDVTDEELWRHAEEYPWLFFNTYDKKVIHTFLQKKFQDLQGVSEKERQDRIQNIRQEHKKHQEEHAVLLRQLGDDLNINYLASVFGKLTIDRLKMKAWWGGGEYLFLPLFEEIARRAGVSVEWLFMSYAVNDIVACLKEQKTVSAEIVDSRMQLYAVVLEDGHMCFYEEQEAREKFDELIGQEDTSDTSADVISGVVANTGKARGKARIIVVEDLQRLLEDMDRFQEGDIMVTTMTQPTMVSLVRKAAAIVTNEGGITSHASILAREYGIPCIVGTRTATFAIKDGDEVEVDANKGIVKKI